MATAASEGTSVGSHPADLGVVEASAALAAGQLSSVELTSACLERIARRDPAYGGWLNVYEDSALAAARAADARRQTGDAGALTGIPVGLKDVVGVAGRPLAGDSPLLKGNVAKVDSAAWTRLEAAGMVLLGHLHCGELACGTWGVNPWDRRFTPGGSSSGSAIAVATRTVPVTLGSDGRGSIRIPSDVNGVTALKPSFGLISTSGCIPITYSYDVLGPMARSAEDCSVLLGVLAGVDPSDRMTLVQPPGVTYPLEPRTGPRPLSGTRIGVPRFADGLLSPGVATVFARFQEELAGLGAELVAYDRPDNPLEENGGAGAGWQTVLSAEALAIHAQFAGREHLHRSEFTEYFYAMTAGMGSALDYVLAQAKRAELVATWRALFAEHRLDAVIEPGSATEIRRLDGDEAEADGHPLDVTAHPWFFGMWNDANFPVLSVPAGPSPKDGVPVGMQVVGLPYQDALLLQIGLDYQSGTEHHRALPPGLDDAMEPYRPPVVPDGGPQPAYVPPRNPFEAIVLTD